MPLQHERSVPPPKEGDDAYPYKQLTVLGTYGFLTHLPLTLLAGKNFADQRYSIMSSRRANRVLLYHGLYFCDG